MKNIINTLNTDLASTSVERCLGTRQSFKSRQKERLIRSFETYDEAEKRTKTRLDKENTGIVKKKDRTGKVNNILLDTNALVTDINKHLANTTKVRSWSELARKHTGWPLVMEIMEIMEKSWNFFWSWKKSWNFKNLPNSHGKVMEVFL